MTATEELTVVAARKNVKLLLSHDDYGIEVGDDIVWASSDIDRFCRLLSCYWPVVTADSYRWMLRRLMGCRVLYSDSCDGQAAVHAGKPVNMFGVVQADAYSPIDDWDNVMDVIGCISQAYG